MIVTETFTIKDKPFIKTYSDSGFMIERDGVRYSEANDPAELNRQYIETDELIEIPEDPEDPSDEPSDDPSDESMTEIEEKAKAYDILMGVSE